MAPEPLASTTAACTLLVESRSAGNVETWITLAATFTPKDHAAVFATVAAVVAAAGAAAAEAVLASTTAAYTILAESRSAGNE